MVKLSKTGSILLGVLIGVTLSACATGFPYKYYTLDAISFEGWLRGPKPADDITLERCKPTAEDKAPCVVMFTKDVYRLRADYEQMEFELDQCQRDL